MSKSDDSKSDAKDSYISGDAKERDSFDVADSKYDDDVYEDGSKDIQDILPPQMWLRSVKLNPDEVAPISSPLEIQIDFELERDVVAGYWIVKFLVDSAENRIIKILGETEPQDYLEGDNDMYFSIEHIPVDDIPPSTLTNSGLLIACFMCEGAEAATVNMVVNVFSQGDNQTDESTIMREIFNPCD